MNALRCMLNSSVSGLWQFGAGIWLIMKYFGWHTGVVQYMDQGYEYLCTCIWDLNGLKSMLGQSAESNA